MRQILAALDFSAVTRAVVEQAASLAGAYGAELTLLHVAAPDPAFVGYDVGPQTVRDARARELRTEHRGLQDLADELRARGLRAKALLVQGPAVETLVREARELGAEAIVLGSHGHGRVYDVLVGSVAHGVLRQAPCPVLVVPASSAPGD
jgi:nucleotide-binding universal stress UspA family protein